jgi:phosphatidylinositol alpha-1,6-mannosyltransferase
VKRLAGRDAVYLGAGVDLARFGAARTSDTDAVPIVGCVSRFVPRKGQQRLLEAAAIVRRAGSRLEVVLVGKGRDERRLRAAAERLGVPTRFAVGVPWDALPGWYAQMDVFCMPCRSRWAGLEVEGLGLVFLEAAAMALPVLAGDSGGAPETVMPGETGYVVHDVADIVEALQMLLGDPDVRSEMGRAGRERIEAEFTWEAVIERLVAGFGRVLGQSAS